MFKAWKEALNSQCSPSDDMVGKSVLLEDLYIVLQELLAVEAGIVSSTFAFQERLLMCESCGHLLLPTMSQQSHETQRSPCLGGGGGGGAENVDYNFHCPTDTNVSIVGSHVWVHVLQLFCAGQATHTPAYFRWTRTLAIAGKHVLQLCTPRHSYIYSARDGTQPTDASIRRAARRCLQIRLSVSSMCSFACSEGLTSS